MRRTYNAAGELIAVSSYAEELERERREHGENRDGSSVGTTALEPHESAPPRLYTGLYL